MTSRGIRNNNPLNIRIGNNWYGEREYCTDKEFEQFECLLYGVRAGFILLKRYIERYHVDTIHDIIHRWAPSSENNTSAYIQTVVERTGISSCEKIRFSDMKTMVALVDAMIFVECGTTIANNIITDAYNMVLCEKYRKL